MQVTMKVACGSIVAALAAMVSLADTAWKADVYSGSWTNAANWTDGVPSAEKTVTINNSGADYVVTVESDAMLYATNTTVGNANGTTTIYVDSPLSLFPRKASNRYSNAFTQNVGARTIVRSGGKIEMAAESVSGEYGPFAGKVTINRSELVLDGGEFDYSGVGYIAMTGAANAPSTLVVTNGGSFTYRHWGQSYLNFSMDAHSRIFVHDGIFKVDQYRSLNRENPFVMDGGQVAVSGNGVFDVQSSNYTFRAIAVNSGSLSFTDNATWKCNYIVLQPKTDDDTITVSFSGNSTLTNGYDNSQAFIGDSHGRTVFDWNSTARAQMGRGNQSALKRVYVGFNRGIGELNVRNGFISLGGYYGMYIGSAEKRDNEDAGCRLLGKAQINDPALFAPTGILRVAGGILYQSCTAVTDGYGAPKLVGLTIGDGALNYDEYSGRPCYGRFELSGGSVTNMYGNFVVGYGHAVGRVVQTGGDFYKGDPSSSWSAPHSVAIGLAGGDGSYVISNGTFTARTRIFVGGASYPDLDTQISLSKSKHPTSPRDAKGLLTLACHDKTKPCILKVDATSTGSITGIKGVWVGRDGDGTVEMIGSGSTLDVQYTGLTLTNGFVVANGETATPGELLTHGQATLRFVFDADGVGQINSANAAVAIAPNAKLEVDMSAYSGTPKKVMLVRCQSRNSSFAPENMTLKNCTIIQDEDANIYAKYKGNSGFVITFR